jgi:hypothetical protein
MEREGELDRMQSSPFVRRSLDEGEVLYESARSNGTSVDRLREAA